jgi:hypothetical protein
VRYSIVAIWVSLNAGGCLFVLAIRRRMQGSEDWGIEVSGADMMAVFAADILMKYWYLMTIVLTIACALFWNAGKRRNPS